MNKYRAVLAGFGVVLCAGVAGAQSTHPIVQELAKHVVQKYQTGSCQDIANQRSRPPQQHTDLERRAVEVMRANPGIRVEFINAVAAPIANKLFECGMLP